VLFVADGAIVIIPATLHLLQGSAADLQVPQVEGFVGGSLLLLQEVIYV
jgi:hypothetical protein